MGLAILLLVVGTVIVGIVTAQIATDSQADHGFAFFTGLMACVGLFAGVLLSAQKAGREAMAIQDIPVATMVVVSASTPKDGVQYIVLKSWGSEDQPRFYRLDSGYLPVGTACARVEPTQPSRRLVPMPCPDTSGTPSPAENPAQ